MSDDKEKEKDKDVAFTIIDKGTVDRLQKDGQVELPQRKLDIPKDQKWNEKLMGSKLLQSIQSGESPREMSKRMQEVINTNEASAMRLTRTMHTSAENHGRLDSYKNLAEQGVVQKKVWSATPDDRTRPSHVDIDGEEQDIDKPFSNGCMFPGDGKGPSEEVWNCRCAMGDHIIGFKRADGSISYVNYDRDATTHDEQMKAEKERRGEALKKSIPKASAVVNGKDISDTWTRRSDKFDFEIEDVINAQGFDGKPRVVSAEEFDRYVQESNFIAQRTYSAPNQETLDAYREQLYNGKWYVDCSTGGAQYGQGMYCAADYTGHLTDGIKNEMEHYKELGAVRNPESAEKAYDDYITNAINNTDNEIEKAGLKVKFGVDTDEDYSIYSRRTREQDRRISKLAEEIEEEARIARNQGISYTETLTLDKSAKIINYKDLVKMKDEDSQKWEDVFWDTGDTKGMDMRDKINSMDIGSYATLKGYDAINAEGHGESGSYTVILNRTKVIIKEDK